MAGVLVAGAGLAGLTQLGCLRYRDEASLLAPDGRWRLSWASRDAFPRLDLVDPAIVVRFRLWRADTGALAAERRAALDEDSDFTWRWLPAPQRRCAWAATGVAIGGFDDRRADRVVELHAPGGS